MDEIQVGDYVLDLHLKENHGIENVGRVLELSKELPRSSYNYYKGFKLAKVAWIDTKQQVWFYACHLQLIPDEDIPMAALQTLGF